MTSIFLFLLLGLICLCIGLLFIIFQLQRSRDSSTQLQQHLQAVLTSEFRNNREESTNQMTRLQESIQNTMTSLAQLQNNQLDTVSKQLNTVMHDTEKRMYQLRESVEKRLVTLQQDNNQKLEQMRATVDEKLHETLEKRLGDSFKMVSERLEHVYQGLGEMKTLATGVGDLKRVLTNVKTRGTWGEVHCKNLLEQVLTPDQFECQVRVKPNSNETVDFAIKLPGKSENKAVYLPLDAKFPLETYQTLLDAQESGDQETCLLQAKSLEKQILHEAKQIHEKYVHPPHTTDFAILYVPIEGLYAEVLRSATIQDTLQTKYRVVLSGPTTLAALLNSLQLGFKTVAIEKRSSEVWSVLAAVKAEFMKFGDILDKTHKKLTEAGNTIETASRKSRTIERKLRHVEDFSDHNAIESIAPDTAFQLQQEKYVD